MDKSKGRVRNILVSNLDSFKELLIRGLIRNNINYLQIDNEFHCFDKIFRFYDVEDACRLIDEGILIFGREDDKIKLLSDINLIFAKEEQDVPMGGNEDMNNNVIHNIQQEEGEIVIVDSNHTQNGPIENKNNESTIISVTLKDDVFEDDEDQKQKDKDPLL
jgi:hypothetical protein